MQMENTQGRCYQITVVLTPREQEIAELMAANLSGMQIAAILKISYNTVNAHLGNIRNKTGTRGAGREELLKAMGV